MENQEQEQKLKSPLKAIRAKCLDCTADHFSVVAKCQIKSCPSYAWRFGRKEKKDINEYTKKSSIRAIKAKCLDCCDNSLNEVKLCTATQCPLYEFRLGKNPYKPEMSEERREALIEKMKMIRQRSL